MYDFYYKYKSNIFKLVFIVFIIIIVYLFFLFVQYDSFKTMFKSEINNRFYKDSINIKKVSKNINDNTISEIDTTINDELNIEKEYNPIVYIYNTHETEKYKSEFKSDYSITPDVKLASYILKDYLNDYKIDSYVETKSTIEYVKKNNLSYTYTYNASRKYLKDVLKKYNFKLVIDLHRDSVSPIYKYNNKKYAKIMFVIGSNHKNYKKNLKISEKINKYLNKNCNGISRGILEKKNSIFNQDVIDNAILIEMGGVDNTLDEVNNSLYVLAKSINDFFKNEGLL